MKATNIEVKGIFRTAAPELSNTPALLLADTAIALLASQWLKGITSSQCIDLIANSCSFVLFNMTCWAQGATLRAHLIALTLLFIAKEILSILLQHFSLWISSKAAFFIPNQVRKDTICAEIASRHLKQQDWKRAMQVIALSNDREEKDVFYIKISGSCARGGDWEKMLQAAEKISNKLKQEWVYVYVAEMCILQKNWVAAVAVGAYVKSCGQRDSIYRCAAWQYVRAKDWGKAREAASLITDNQMRNRIYASMSAQLALLGKRKKMKDLIALIDDAALQDAVFSRIAKEQVRRKNSKEALRATKEIIDIDRRDDTYRYCAQKYADNQEWTKAREMAAQLSREDKKRAALQQISETLYRQSKKEAWGHLLVT